jgi:hypothetical protein
MNVKSYEHEANLEMVNFKDDMETTTMKSNQNFELVMETNFDILHNGPTCKNK